MGESDSRSLAGKHSVNSSRKKKTALKNAANNIFFLTLFRVNVPRQIDICA